MVRELSRRSMLFTTAGAMAGVGVGSALWPLIASMNPDASALTKGHLVIDLARIAEGKRAIHRFNGVPLEVRHRTPNEIKSESQLELPHLIDARSRNENSPRSDASDVHRTVNGQGKFVVIVRICTLKYGCELVHGGRYGGWFCPCCGSSYDTAGRSRYGPAPHNLAIPKYAVSSATKIELDARWRFRPL